jgi:esterase/lipase
MNQFKTQAVEYDPFIENNNIGEEFPLTEPQKEILSSIQIGGDDASRAFNEAICIEMKGQLNLDFLIESIKKLCSRHDALRMRINPEKMTFTISDTYSPSIQIIDISSESTKSILSKKESIKNKLVNESFDLKNGPLIRFVIIKKSKLEYFLLFSVHSICCDGWSIDVIIEELSKLYSSNFQNKKSESNVIPPIFTEYALKQNKFLKKELYEYWKTQFKDLPPEVLLHSNYDSDINSNFKSSQEDLLISDELTDKLKQTAGKNAVSFFSLMLASFHVLLFKLSSQKTVTTGISYAGQSLHNKSDLVGNCTYILPVTSRITAHLQFIDCIKNINTTLMDIRDHLPFTYSQILRQHNITSVKYGKPLISINFNITHKMEEAQTFFHGLEICYDILPKEFSPFDVSINLITKNKNCVIKCLYNTSLLNATEIKSILNEYQHLLMEIVESNNKPISDINIAHFKKVIINKRKDQLFYFGKNEQKCFGVLHSPDSSSIIKDTGIVICTPLYHEYIRSYRALRLLAERLSEAGYYVMRFDYYDHGDSWGKSSEGNVSIWEENITNASKELINRTGVSAVSLIGLRFGADLAADLCDKGFKIKNLVLWDPIENGTKYLTELYLLNKGYFRYSFNSKLAKSTHEFIGFNYNENMQKGIKNINISSMELNCAEKIFLIVSDKNGTNDLFKNKNNFSFYLRPYNGEWNNPTKYYNTLIVNNIIDDIIKIIEK